MTSDTCRDDSTLTGNFLDLVLDFDLDLVLDLDVDLDLDPNDAQTDDRSGDRVLDQRLLFSPTSRSRSKSRSRTRTRSRTTLHVHGGSNETRCRKHSTFDAAGVEAVDTPRIVTF